MATQTRRETRTIREWLLLPVEWAHGLALSVAERLNQERWANLVVILGAVIVNLLILSLLLQGADNRAIALSIVILTALLALRYPEVSITTFIVVGTGLFVNAFWYAAPGVGTGQRTILLGLLLIVSFQAIVEYLRLPKEQRPRIWTPLTAALVFFWLYHMAHVGYIYIFHYHTIPADNALAVLGAYTQPVVRYFDGHILWIGVLPLMVLLRDWARARRVLTALSLVMVISTVALVWEYFAPLPEFYKILFQLKAAGETAEGYRVRSPAGLYFSMVLFFASLYMVGYVRGVRLNTLVLLYLVAFTWCVIITKNRILWAGMLLVLPLAILWKPPQVLVRQSVVLGVACLIGASLLLHPPAYEVFSRVISEMQERWSRNYAYGGDPRLDPSYQYRQDEREKWESRYQQLGTFQKLFGAGLEATYGKYATLQELGYRVPYQQVYVEKIHIHFAWLGRILRYGWVGTALLALVIVIFFLRATWLFWKHPMPVFRAIIVGLVGAVVGALSFDSLHMLLHSYEAVPLVLMWSFMESIPRWVGAENRGVVSDSGAA